jgi:hypothetical protein
VSITWRIGIAEESDVKQADAHWSEDPEAEVTEDEVATEAATGNQQRSSPRKIPPVTASQAKSKAALKSKATTHDDAGPSILIAQGWEAPNFLEKFSVGNGKYAEVDKLVDVTKNAAKSPLTLQAGDFLQYNTIGNSKPASYETCQFYIQQVGIHYRPNGNKFKTTAVIIGNMRKIEGDGWSVWSKHKSLPIGRMPIKEARAAKLGEKQAAAQEKPDMSGMDMLWVMGKLLPRPSTIDGAALPASKGSAGKPPLKLAKSPSNLKGSKGARAKKGRGAKGGKSKDEEEEEEVWEEWPSTLKGSKGARGKKSTGAKGGKSEDEEEEEEEWEEWPSDLKGIKNALSEPKANEVEMADVAAHSQGTKGGTRKGRRPAPSAEEVEEADDIADGADRKRKRLQLEQDEIASELSRKKQRLENEEQAASALRDRMKQRSEDDEKAASALRDRLRQDHAEQMKLQREFQEKMTADMQSRELASLKAMKEAAAQREEVAAQRAAEATKLIQELNEKLKESEAKAAQAQTATASAKLSAAEQQLKTMREEVAALKKGIAATQESSDKELTKVRDAGLNLLTGSGRDPHTTPISRRAG